MAPLTSGPDFNDISAISIKDSAKNNIFKTVRSNQSRFRGAISSQPESLNTFGTAKPLKKLPDYSNEATRSTLEKFGNFNAI